MSPATHPLDALLREMLRTRKPNQKLLAKRINRSQGWVNKYLNGSGKATIDDVIRLVALVVLGVESGPPLRAEQRKLLRDFDALPPEGRKEVKRFLAFWASQHLAPRPKSNARAEQTTSGAAGKSPGTR